MQRFYAHGESPRSESEPSEGAPKKLPRDGGCTRPVCKVGANSLRLTGKMHHYPLKREPVRQPSPHLGLTWGGHCSRTCTGYPLGGCFFFLQEWVSLVTCPALVLSGCRGAAGGRGAVSGACALCRERANMSHLHFHYCHKVVRRTDTFQTVFLVLITILRLS